MEEGARQREGGRAHTSPPTSAERRIQCGKTAEQHKAEKAKQRHTLWSRRHHEMRREPPADLDDHLCHGEVKDQELKVLVGGTHTPEAVGREGMEAEAVERSHPPKHTPSSDSDGAQEKTRDSEA